MSRKGKVESGALRWKITVFGLGASVLFRFASSEEAPFGFAILMLRSNENLTSSEVRAEPSEKVRPSFSVHW